MRLRSTRADAACTRRPRSGTPGTPVLQDLLHGSRLGARCLGRDHRGGCGFGRRLSGEHGLRPAGAGPVHHRHHVAAAKLASGADAGAHRARNHDDGHCRRLSRLRFAGGMGLWPGRSFDPRQLGALPGALRRGDRLARGPRNFGCRVVERAFQSRLGPGLGGPGDRSRQHHPDFLADRPRLRHSGVDGSRGSPSPDRDLFQQGDRNDPLGGHGGDGAQNPQVHGGADVDEPRDRRPCCSRSRGRPDCNSPSNGG